MRHPICARVFVLLMRAARDGLDPHRREALAAARGRVIEVGASLVLRSVSDRAVALAESRRVLAPGGHLLFYEHVISQDPRIARRQRRIAPLWQIERVRRFDLDVPMPTRPHVIGVARS